MRRTERRAAPPCVRDIATAVTLALVTASCGGGTEPDPPDEEALTLTSVVSADHFSCALEKGGAAYCWGRNDMGQLGRGLTSESGGVDTVSGGLRFSMLAAGGDNVCGLAQGKAYCWGDRFLFVRAENMLSPMALLFPSTSFVSVSVGFRFACALTAEGEAWCWGQNDVLGGGQLGDGTVESSPLGVRVVGGLRLTQLSSGFANTCGLAGGEVWCWGSNVFKALGTYEFGASASPVRAGLERTATTTTVGAAISCATVAEGIQCWGINETGQLGRGTAGGGDGHPAAVASSAGLSHVALSAVNRIATHVCALAGDRAAHCWGANDMGQLGATATDVCDIDGLTFACALTPIPVETDLRFDAVSVGAQHSCGLSDGRVWCWGGNESGELGSAGAASATPVQVVFDG